MPLPRVPEESSRTLVSRLVEMAASGTAISAELLAGELNPTRREALEHLRELYGDLLESSRRKQELERANADLQRTQAELRENARFLESILENIPAMIFVKDAASLRFVRFNRAGEELLGHDRSELLGQSDRELLPPEEAEAFTLKDQEVLDGGQLVDIAEDPILTRHHGLRYFHTKKLPIFDDAGRPRYLLGISEDITQRKVAQGELARRTEELANANQDLRTASQRLRTSGEHLRVLLEHFPGAVWTADARLRLTSTAGARALALGLDPDVVVGRSLCDCLPTGAARAEALLCHERALAGEFSSFEFQAGSAIYEVCVEPLKEQGSSQVIAVALDVTERRRVEAERLELRLQRAQKMESLGILAGGIAHDFNNLLAGIIGNASLAHWRLPPDSPALKNIERVEASAERAAELTRQMLAYSGKGRFVIEPVDVSALVGEMASLLEVSISKKVTLALDFAPGLPLVKADVAQLRQVVMNLITNASDSMQGEGGTIRLSTSQIEADQEVLSSAWLADELPAGRYVELTVADTGAGMDEATQHRMFDPFFTTKEEGHGLGLAATLGIIRGHSGAITVESNPGRGTTIRVLLPASPGTIGSPAVEPPGEIDAPSGGTILVVDDEAAVRQFVAETLEMAGFVVLEAEDGVQALEVFRAEGGRVDGVLLDVTMPRLGGEETFTEMRRLRPEVPVLVTSGYNEQEAMGSFSGLEPGGFLQKPFRAGELLSMVRQMLAPFRADPAP